MKKVFAIALIAASFVACNEGETKVDETTTTDTTTIVEPITNDTTQVITDSTVTTTVTVDSVK